MSDFSQQAEQTADRVEEKAAAEAEFEVALREVEARVDRRLKESAELRYSIEQELSTERARTAQQDREVQRLRSELKRMVQVSASTEAKLNAFEQMLEAVEDDIDERIAAVEERSLGQIAEANRERDLVKADLRECLAKAQVEADNAEKLAAENKALRQDSDQRIAAVEARSLSQIADANKERDAVKADLRECFTKAQVEAENAEKLAAENKALRLDIEKLSGQLDQMRSNWLWRTVAKLRRVHSEEK